LASILGESEMLIWFQRLENAAKWFAQKYYLLVALAIPTVVGIVFFDTQLQVIYHSSNRLIKSIGKGFGELTANIALLALGYYLLREAYVASLKRKIPMPSELVPYVKTGISILRFLHPVAGVLAISLAIMHGYIMWVIWGGLSRGLVLASGFLTLLAALILGGLGWGIQRRQASVFFRQKHKMIAFLALIFYVFHKAIAD
jgi:hypothetical protein